MSPLVIRVDKNRFDIIASYFFSGGHDDFTGGDLGCLPTVDYLVELFEFDSYVDVMEIIIKHCIYHCPSLKVYDLSQFIEDIDYLVVARNVQRVKP